MQSLALFAIFGVIYGTISLFTASISQSSMAHKAANVEKTEQILKDIEFVVTDKILLEASSLEDYAANFSVETMLTTQPVFAQATGRTTADLTTDPWGSTIQVRHASSTYAVSSSAIAPIDAIGLFSPGPDRVFQTTVPVQSGSLTYNDLQRVEAAAGSDDIVHVFTTMTAMKRNWNQLEAILRKAEGLAMYNYQQKVAEFQPIIDQYYTNNSAAIFASGFALSDSKVGIWQTGDAAQSLAPIAVTTSGYPRMASTVEEIGLDEELKSLPKGLQVAVTPNVCDLPESCRLFVISASQTPNSSGQRSNHRWQVGYGMTLDGATGRETKFAIHQGITSERARIAAQKAAEEEARRQAALAEAARIEQERIAAANAAAAAEAARVAAANAAAANAAAAAAAAAPPPVPVFDFSALDGLVFDFSGGWSGK